MQHRKICDWKAWAPAALAGGAAGLVNGFFGGGGGMVLVPLLAGKCGLERRNAFASSVAIILPVCVTVLAASLWQEGLSLSDALPYLPGSAFGGLFAGLWGKKIPVQWLHRLLGIFILWGGIRYLC